MAFNLAGGFGAGAGADMLQQILKQKALEFAQAEARKQEDQRIAIDQQRATSEDALRRAALEDRQTAQAADAKSHAQTGALKLASNLRIGQEVNPATAAALAAGDFGDTVKGATLSSRNIGQGMTSAPNPGRGPSFLGTAGQQEDATAEDAYTRDTEMNPDANRRGQLRMLKSMIPDINKRGPAAVELLKEQAKGNESEDVYTLDPRTGKMVKSGSVAKGSHITTVPAPPQQQLITIQTVDANGNAVTKVVPKTAGSEFTKPASATTANRVASAETVNRLSDDMITRLSDPALAKTLGPAMGRYNTLQDFIGDPPPEFAELAGEIESFALANMGVHGMRSAQGAQQITEMLNRKQTPESLAAKIRGLSKFSNDFAQHNKPTSGNAPPSGAAAKETPEQRAKRLLGGG